MTTDSPTTGGPPAPSVLDDLDVAPPADFIPPPQTAVDMLKEMESSKAEAAAITGVANDDAPPAPQRFLVIDTETSDIVDFKKAADAEGQGRLAHLAMIYVNEHLDVTKVSDIYIKPDGWSMQPKAAEVNGLSDEFLNERGRPIAEALDLYTAALAEGRVVIAHHAQFDLKIMRGELRRAGRPDNFEETPNACTMRSSVGVCKIPQVGRGGFKWPKLEELCNHFNIPYERVHRAPDDAMCCYKAFVRLMKMGVLQTPRVHFAKNQIPPVYDTKPA